MCSAQKSVNLSKVLIMGFFRKNGSLTLSPKAHLFHTTIFHLILHCQLIVCLCVWKRKVHFSLFSVHHVSTFCSRKWINRWFVDSRLVKVLHETCGLISFWVNSQVSRLAFLWAQTFFLTVQCKTLYNKSSSVAIVLLYWDNMNIFSQWMLIKHQPNQSS